MSGAALLIQIRKHVICFCTHGTAEFFDSIWIMTITMVRLQPVPNPSKVLTTGKRAGNGGTLLLNDGVRIVSLS